MLDNASLSWIIKNWKGKTNLKVISFLLSFLTIISSSSEHANSFLDKGDQQMFSNHSFIFKIYIWVFVDYKIHIDVRLGLYNIELFPTNKTSNPHLLVSF